LKIATESGEREMYLSQRKEDEGALLERSGGGGERGGSSSPKEEDCGDPTPGKGECRGGVFRNRRAAVSRGRPVFWNYRGE